MRTLALIIALIIATAAPAQAVEAPPAPVVLAWEVHGPNGAITLGWEQSSDAPLWILTNRRNVLLAYDNKAAPGPQRAHVDAELWWPGRELTLQEFWPDGRRAAATYVVAGPHMQYVPIVGPAPPRGISISPR